MRYGSVVTQTLKIDRILELVELTAVQVGQLTFEMAEVKEALAEMKIELTKKADKSELQEMRFELNSKIDYKFGLLKDELDKKPDREEFRAFRQSVNENDAVYTGMLLDHDRDLKRLKKLAGI